MPRMTTVQIPLKIGPATPPGVWNPLKVRVNNKQARMEYWLFRQGLEEFYSDIYEVEVHDDCAVVKYYLHNRKGSRYYNRFRDAAASAVIVLYGCEIPDWMRR